MGDYKSIISDLTSIPRSPHVYLLTYLRLGQVATTIMYPGYIPGTGLAMRKNQDEDVDIEPEITSLTIIIHS